MKVLSNYMKRKIAHFYKKTESSWLTLSKFNISYKELYKVINNSSILSYKIIKWITHKRCSVCQSYKPYNEEYFYKRSWTEYYYSQCKYCMNIMARNYKIINKKKQKEKQREWSKQYYLKNREAVLNKRRSYYRINKTRISYNKKRYYTKSKMLFIKNFITKLR